MSCKFAAVVNDSVSLVACETDALSSVELTTEGRHFAADSLVVEIVSLRAFKAFVLVPGFAAIMVGYIDEITEGDRGSSRVEAAEVTVERTE